VVYSNFEWCKNMDTIRLTYDIHFYENGKYGNCENISKVWIYLFTVY